MIHRKKPKTPPVAFIDSKWDQIKNDVLIAKNNHKADERLYRETTIDSLTEIFKYKSAYCERDRGDELHVDHYRPRKARKHKLKTKYNQSGYYWLTYEWSNFLPLCSKCNTKKSNKFPLEGWSDRKRITSHLDLSNHFNFKPFDLLWLNLFEQPLLLNPEIETNFTSHFHFDDNCKIIGKTHQSEETIIICDLNRNDLKRERLVIRNNIVNGIKEALVDFSISNDQSMLRGELKGIFKNIIKNCHEDQPHSLFHTYLYMDFNTFIDSKLPLNLRGQATKYFVWVYFFI